MAVRRPFDARFQIAAMIWRFSSNSALSISPRAKRSLRISMAGESAPRFAWLHNEGLLTALKGDLRVLEERLA